MGDTQDLPTCHDSGLWCYDVAKPQVVEGFWNDSSLDVWSDNGWCNLGDQASESIKMACPRSSDPSCDEDRAVYVQSWCLKTCYESGDLPYARPCYDPCTFEEHPCTFPFTFEGAAFEVCLSLEKKDGRRPPRASEHGTSEDEATVQWCGVKTELLQGDFQGLDWAYCSCAALRASTTATSSPTASVISTTTPTASASTINIVAACPETSGRLSAAMAEQCSQFLIRQECTLDLSSLRGPLTCNQAAISVPAHFSLYLVDSQQDLVLTCGDGNNDLDDTYLFYLHENASLVLDGVSVANCSGAVYQGAYSHFEIQNASISGNQNLAGPAGVFWGGSYATTRVLCAVIFNNIGASAGVFSNANGVGSLDVIFQNSRFENNTAMEAGGIVALSSEPGTVAGGRLWVESCTFRRNIAATRGGLLSVGRGLLSLRATFLGCYFEDHRAFKGGLFYLGDSGVNYELLDLSRAERLVRVIVRKSFVRAALAHVGAFVSQVYDGNTAVIVDQTSLTAARVTNHGALVAITSRPSSLNLDGANQNIFALAMSDSQIFENVADVDGGVLSIQGPARVLISNSSFTDNHAKGGGGGVLLAAGAPGMSLSMVSSRFENNSALSNGGALLMTTEANVTLTDSTFHANVALIADNLNSTKNQALSRAGALRVRSGASLAVNGSVHFIQNTARSHGGAMALDLGSHVALSGISEFKANRILGSDAGAGGAIAVVPGAGHLLEVNISNATFEGNYALAAPLIYVDLVADLRLVSKANDWALVAANNGVFSLQNVSFDKATHAKPITTAPAALKVCPAQLDRNDDDNDNDQLTCAFQTETIASLSTHSGGYLSPFCAVLVDAFDEPFVTPRELVLPLVIQTPAALKTSVHLPEPFAGTLALQDSLLIRGIRVVAATGNYTLHLQPKLHSQHLTSKRRIASAKLPVLVDHCRGPLVALESGRADAEIDGTLVGAIRARRDKESKRKRSSCNVKCGSYVQSPETFETRYVTARVIDN
ncbi:Hypothetical Protein FCC1311_078802 [Hondaea fermentalgiana]|uniref:Fibronectin type-II domain-containing protein n=1 Tax=Hondaea fermentalgiana TaxID=2315210 RepID=A0A2R5GM03_9STRA|nr:Hypothetical Protein FCC1311_078802 [Hondaea fermentalgiana]|eukprot:GBG31655.1 Hypothetical Protein FCC1311_078802 [Hondaea fermentalgiana]